MRRTSLACGAVSVSLAGALAGCPGPMEDLDASVTWADQYLPGDEDAFAEDAFVPEGVDANFPDSPVIPADAGTDAFFAGDAGMIPSDRSDPAPPSTVERMGTSGLLLRGTVLAPSGPITPGEVLIVGNTIQCVAASCASHPMAADATVIATNATISPGLIDGHNHATYDFLPPWVSGELFDSRYDWRGDAAYSMHIKPESDGGSTAQHVCPSTKWAELRSIVHGTTTIQGQSPQSSCVDRLARNADHYHGLPARSNTSFGTSIAGPCEGGGTGSTAMNDTWRRARIAEWEDGDVTRLAVHMGEGVRGTGATRTNVLREYDCYRGRATGGSSGDHTVDLLEDASGMPYGTAYFIHGTAMTAAQIDDAHAAGAFFVWSPSSNLILYGATADIGHMLELGAAVGIGPDWTVSGAQNVLGEMRFGYEYGRAEGIAALTPERLFLMATRDGARVVDLDENIGTIEVGKRADLVVFGRVSSDPYRAVLDSEAADVRLVLIDGLGYYGDVALETATAVNGMCDDFDACGTAKFLCVANTPGSTVRADETYEDIRSQLIEHLESGYPGCMTASGDCTAEGTSGCGARPACRTPAYGRGSELQELVTCR
ncbi:MAG: amidohydrolase family protein [Deltaproteobacteria bacterium]|nr:amidohydrolase family protein [Deltaproteobacteria bacterium]